MDAEGAGRELRELAGRARARRAWRDAAGRGARASSDRALPRGAAQERPRVHGARAPDSRTTTTWRSSAARALLEKSFYNLTEDEIARMREVVEPPGAEDQERALDPPQAPQEAGKLDLHTMLRRNMAPRRRPVRAGLQAAQEGSPEARDPVRRVVVGRERLALHAAVRLQPAGVLHEDPLLRVRRGARRGDASSSRTTTSARRSRRRSTAAT